MSVSDDEFESKRLHPRQRRLLKARMRHPRYGEVDILIRDISERGLGGKSDLDLSVGDKIVITLPDCAPAHGNIVWRKGHAFGVRLDRPINPEAIKPPPPTERAIEAPYQAPDIFRPNVDTRRPGFRTRIPGPDTNSKWR